ncbi:acyltransferase family-domain-containing protein [Apiosordaria backusii]|uniref:Acyltransferase family-domain-containing protein n=1 Tax=Apiosordaria backusii TaxID=314023 RepID=A0AA40K453_9PEZI|nr:acyltransferase family-domain-containing protein [Apiosordaria backusii]
MTAGQTGQTQDRITSPLTTTPLFPRTPTNPTTTTPKTPLPPPPLLRSPHGSSLLRHLRLRFISQTPHPFILSQPPRLLFHPLQPHLPPRPPPLPPPAISTLFIVILVRLGAYTNTDSFAHDERYIRNVQETHYKALNTTAEQVGDWIKGTGEFVHAWDWEVFGGLTRMDVHLWTIPVEFRASMMLFLVMMGLGRVKQVVRWVGVMGVMGYCFGSGRWEVMLFLWGGGLAEVDVHQQGRDRGEKKGSWWWVGLSILGLFFMSQPDQGSETTPGWVMLTSMIPGWWVEEERYRYYQSLGAALFVLAVGRSKGWQGVFTWGPVQYLGRISYAMYLMHGPVLHTFGYAVERFVWTRVTGVETEGMYNLGFGLAAVVIVPAVIWVSDVFWRGVDAPVVRFARWVEGVCTVKE